MTPEQRGLVESNYGLVIKLANDMRQQYPLADYDSLVSDGGSGIMRAAVAYEQGKGSFPTMAWHWIRYGMMDGIKKACSRPVTERLGKQSISRTHSFDAISDSEQWGVLLAHLDQRTREVVLMYVRDGLNEPEIASRIGKSCSTVSKILAKGTRVLRRTTFSKYDDLPIKLKGGKGRHGGGRGSRKAVVSCRGEKFSSISEASVEMGCNSGSIAIACQRGTKCAGRNWKYAEAA